LQRSANLFGRERCKSSDETKISAITRGITRHRKINDYSRTRESRIEMQQLHSLPMIDRDRLVSVTKTTSAARGKCGRFLLIFCLLFIDLGFEPTFKCERALCTQVLRSSGCLGCREKLSRNVVYARFSNPHIFSCWLEQSEQSRLISPARTRSI